jgi:competence CoiA-like predicted nuclease
MFIDYGLDDNGELVYIDQAQRGKTALACPYCGGMLTAKKGQIKSPHFAHSGETCAAAQRDTTTIDLRDHGPQ